MSNAILIRRHSAGSGIDYSLYENQYLTMEFIHSGTISFVIPASVDSTHITNISYKVNNGDWVTTTNTSSAVTISINVALDDIVQWKGNIPHRNYINESTYAHFADDGDPIFELYGNIMSLYWGDDFRNKELFPWSVTHNSINPPIGIAYGLFQGTSVYSAENLILSAQNLYTSDTQNAHHYAHMFQNCVNLIYPPAVLPARIIGAYTYYQMFMGCTSLVRMPNMESIEDTIGRGAYQNMFKECTSLSQNTQQTIHMNKATYQMCQDMFSGCTSMVNAPNIEVYSFDNNLALSGNGVALSFANMFRGCTALKTPPERIDLDAIDNGTFSQMFTNCASLEYAPIINIRKVNYINDTLTPKPGRYTFEQMFRGCTSLVDGSGINIYFPENSEWSGERTFYYMFHTCVNMLYGPSLHINGTIKAISEGTFNRCCMSCKKMSSHDIEINHNIKSNTSISTGSELGNAYAFHECLVMKDSPRIIRSALRDNEFTRAFDSDTQLSNVWVKFDTNAAGNGLTNWLIKTGTGSSSRTVHQAGSATLPTSSASGVPSGWTLDTTNWTAQRHARMTIYIDNFPTYGVSDWYEADDDQGRDTCIHHFINNIDECGEIFNYYGDTVTINNKTYFIWESREYENNPNEETEIVSILLTTTDNFYELTLNSLSNSYDIQSFTDLGKSFDWVYGLCHSDNTVTYSKNDFLSMGKFMVKVVRNQG